MVIDRKPQCDRAKSPEDKPCR